MLQELDLAMKSKEEFTAAYTPVRKSVEDFLRGGQKVPKNTMGKLFALIANIEHGKKIYPRWEREISVNLAGSTTRVRIKAETDGFLYPHSNDIENSYIMITLMNNSDPNNGKNPVAIIPPLKAFKNNEIPWEKWTNIPQRVSEILPLLPQL